MQCVHKEYITTVLLTAALHLTVCKKIDPFIDIAPVSLIKQYVNLQGFFPRIILFNLSFSFIVL